MNSGANDESFHFLVQANDVSELIWKYYLKFIFIAFPALTLAVSAVSVVVCFWVYGRFDTKYLYYMYKFA